MAQVTTIAARQTNIGRLIQERRERVGWSQEDLARAVHVQRTAISNIERGETKVPTVELVNAIAQVLPVTVREMVQAIGYRFEEDAELVSRMHHIRGIADELRRALDQASGEPPAPPRE